MYKLIDLFRDLQLAMVQILERDGFFISINVTLALADNICTKSILAFRQEVFVLSGIKLKFLFESSLA